MLFVYVNAMIMLFSIMIINGEELYLLLLLCSHGLHWNYSIQYYFWFGFCWYLCGQAAKFSKVCGVGCFSMSSKQHSGCYKFYSFRNSQLRTFQWNIKMDHKTNPFFHSLHLIESSDIFKLPSQITLALLVKQRLATNVSSIYLESVNCGFFWFSPFRIYLLYFVELENFYLHFYTNIQWCTLPHLSLEWTERI